MGLQPLAHIPNNVLSSLSFTDHPIFIIPRAWSLYRLLGKNVTAAAAARHGSAASLIVNDPVCAVPT
jgi:hypothetical protein